MWMVAFGGEEEGIRWRRRSEESGSVFLFWFNVRCNG